MKLIDWKRLKSEKGIPYSRQHILRLENDGRFPKRVRFGNNSQRIAWVESEIDAWIEQFAKARSD